MTHSLGVVAAATTSLCDEPTLDQLLAEPIVRQLMRRDQTDEATIRHLLRRSRTARLTSDRETCWADDTDIVVRYLHKTAQLRFSRYECVVLTYLAQHKGVDPARLAQVLDVSPPALFRVVDQLEAAGLVQRILDLEGRRSEVLALTAKALPIIECIHGMTKKTFNV
jgi:DNA-binding MarR family transcriptional regulator